MDTFHKKFLWGGAISNVQAEGAYRTDGKGLNVYDTFEVQKEKGQKNINKVDIASNHYYQFKEDIELMNEMGFKACRFSIVWSRIYPNGTEEGPNEMGLDYYERMINNFLEKGIEPVVSLVHFDMPDHLSKKYNGFYSREVVDFFANHVGSVVKRFSSKVKYWITYNEMNTAPYWPKLVAGANVPDNFSQEEFYSTLVHNTQLAHAKAVLIIKKWIPDAKVSGMINFTHVHPKTSEPKDIEAAHIINNYMSFLTFDIMTTGRYPRYYKNFLALRNIEISDSKGFEIIQEASRKLDFLSVSYYQTQVISGPDFKNQLEFENSVIFNPHLEVSKYTKSTDWGWAIDPKGFKMALEALSERYNMSIFIVENGIGLEEKVDELGQIIDDKRIYYYKNHIKAMQDAIQYEGVQILGYLAWAPFDFLSSHKEMRKRYGFIYIDSENVTGDKLKRIPKKSFYWYKNLIETNGEIL
ncbi:MAG: glycoside hydrolase family 1 protein [Eubacteriales bacterium]